MGLFKSITKAVDNSLRWVDREIFGNRHHSSGSVHVQINAKVNNDLAERQELLSLETTFNQLTNEYNILSSRYTELSSRSNALTLSSSSAVQTINALSNEFNELSQQISTSKAKIVDLDNRFISNIDHVFEAYSHFPEVVKSYLAYYLIKEINEFKIEDHPELGLSTFDKDNMLSLVSKSTNFQQNLSLTSYDQDQETSESLGAYIASSSSLTTIFRSNLLKNISDLNERDHTGHTFLHHLIIKNNKAGIIEAKNAGADFTCAFSNGKSLLYNLVKYTDVETINLVFNNNPPINEEPLLLHAAAESANEQTFDWAIRVKPGEYDRRDTDGNTPMLLAIQKGCGYIVDKLITANANLNIANNKDITSLLLLSQLNSLDYASEFASRGANPMQKDSDGNNVLHNFIKAFGSDILISRDTVIPLDQPCYSNFIHLKTCFVMQGCMITGHYGSKIAFEVKDNNVHMILGGMERHAYSVDEVRQNNYNYSHVIQALRFFTTQGVSVNDQNNNGITPLMSAASSKLFYLTNYIIDNFTIDYSLADLNGYRITHHAIISDKANWQEPSLVAKLVSNGADINAQDNYGRTILHWATLYNSIPLVQKILELGINIHIPQNDQYLGYLPIHLAAFNNFNDLLEILVPLYGVDCSTSKLEQTPLMIACQQGKLEAIRFLLDHGADANAVSNQSSKENSLIYASINGHVDVINLLLDRGADINKVDSQEATPLFFSLAYNKHDATQLLISRGAHVNKQMNDGDCPLHQSAYSANIKGFEILISARAIINQINHQGMTALHTLISNTKNTNLEHKISCIKLLIDANIDLDIVDNAGKKALDYARELLPEAIEIIESAINSTSSSAEIITNSSDKVIAIKDDPDYLVDVEDAVLTTEGLHSLSILGLEPIDACTS